MNKADKKQKILALLLQRKVWLGISDVINFLGDEFKMRTVRRLLSELRSETKVLRTGRGPSTRYHININTPTLSNGLVEENNISKYLTQNIFSQESLAIINDIRKPLFHRTPVSYNKKWLDSYVPNETNYFSKSQRMEMVKQGNRNLNNQMQPAGTYSRRILNRLLIDLSYNSSRLEGNTYSKLDTERLLVEGIQQEGKLDQERVMILNHKYAIEYLVRQTNRLTVSYQTICTLHYLLSDGLLPIEYMGKIRNDSVRIGQSTYLPLEDKLRIESNLISLLELSAQIVDPFEQSLFLLVQIAYLQPFMDVNKRTSRLSTNIPLIKNNYVPLSFNELYKEDYISAMLSVYELNQVKPMADLYYYSYLRTCKAYDATVESVGFDPIRVKYRRQRRSIITLIIRNNLASSKINAFIKNKTISIDLDIDESDQQAFTESVEKELMHLSINTIGGLGITQSEFEQWKDTQSEYIYNKSKR